MSTWKKDADDSPKAGYRWCDKSQIFIYKKRKGLVYRYTWMNYYTTLWLTTQVLCNVAGVLKAHALTKHDACANCRAKEQWILLILLILLMLWCVRILPGMMSHVTVSDVTSSIPLTTVQTRFIWGFLTVSFLWVVAGPLASPWPLEILILICVCACVYGCHEI